MALVLCTGVCGAQTVNGVDMKTLAVEYLQIVGVNVGMFKKKIVISVDWGQEVKWLEGSTIVGPDGKAVVFQSMMGALNQFVEWGWEYVDAYTLTVGTDASSSQVYHFTMRKKR